MDAHEERNALILRRTLSVISGLYAIFDGGLGALTWSAGLVPQLMVGHGALLGLAAVLLWKPRRGAAAATLLAAAGSIGLVAIDLRRGTPQAAIIDGLYVVVAAALLYNSRRDA